MGGWVYFVYLFIFLEELQNQPRFPDSEFYVRRSQQLKMLKNRLWSYEFSLLPKLLATPKVRFIYGLSLVQWIEPN